MHRRAAALLLLAALASCGQKESAEAATQGTPYQATVPLFVEGHRPYIELQLTGANGVTRTARFLVDSGGGAFILTESLARELGLEWGEVLQQEGRPFAMARSAPRASVGDFPLGLNAERIAVMIGQSRVLPDAAPGHEDGMVPGHVLSQYHVVFDYPKGQFTIALPGVLTPTGERLPMPVSKGQGFPRTEIVVDGRTHGLLLDTGASFTMISEVLLERWGGEHSDWERHPGAHGEAATLGGQTLETMYIPRGLWGPLELTRFGVVSQSDGTFERYMSPMMTSPIIGSLAGNVLEQFRVELDYPNQTLYLTRD
jgi:hypothetical protein